MRREPPALGKAPRMVREKSFIPHPRKHDGEIRRGKRRGILTSDGDHLVGIMVGRAS